MEQNTIKEIPYGVSDFATIVEQNIYYVDKTMYIPKLENEARNLFFIRPRRFGKSLFLSMLHAYYDCRTKDKFQQWFGDLWIGKHPTPLRGRYQVLHLDFSQVGGTIEQLESKFNEYCCIILNEFMDRYAEYYPEETKKGFYASRDTGAKLDIITAKASNLGYPLYLIIDEYDNFTNTVLNEQGENVINSTERIFNDFFRKIKGKFEHILIMGSSPVMFDGSTSTFDFGWNISVDEKFHQMLGFSTEEVKDMFNYYKEKGKLPTDMNIDEVICKMKSWYANYCFTEKALEDHSTLFNCEMALYYLRKSIYCGESPQYMSANFVKVSLKNLFPHDKYASFRKEKIKELLQKGEIRTRLAERYSIFDLSSPELLASQLFYKGVLTIVRTYGYMTVLAFPNKSTRLLYESELARFLKD